MLEIGQKYDRKFFKPVFLEAPEPLKIADNYVFECFEKFSDYAVANRGRLKSWLPTHMIPEIWEAWTDDNILRFPEYGKLAGPNEYYLNHPLRDAFSFPTSGVEPAFPPNVPVS